MKNRRIIIPILLLILACACNFMTPPSITLTPDIPHIPPTITAPTHQTTSAPKPTHTSCTLFPVDNFWNTPIDSLPTHPQSDGWINSIGSGTWDGGPIGIPFNIVAGSTVPKYKIEFYYPDESDAGPYPLPENPNREWDSDHHILVVDTDTCTLYEIYDAKFDNGT